MKILDLWDIESLLEKIWKARADLRNHPQGCFADKNGNSACMVDVIAPPSYHQVHEIAAAFRLEYDELLMNEGEMERFRKNLVAKTNELLADLNRRVLTPDGYWFSMGYDPEGNFGLLLLRNETPVRDGEKRGTIIAFPRFGDPRDLAKSGI
jgi:hypothetical protein